MANAAMGSRPSVTRTLFLTRRLSIAVSRIAETVGFKAMAETARSQATAEAVTFWPGGITKYIIILNKCIADGLPTAGVDPNRR